MAETINLNEQEFNTFGPWTYEITDQYPIPRLFEPYFTDDDPAIIKLKVPRDIDRRNANPEMDLYDFVIALYQDHLRILQRQESVVKEYLIKAKDFMGIRIYKNLLKGACTIYSIDGAISFPFNTVSMDLIWKFAGLTTKTLETSDTTERKIDLSVLPVTDSEPETMLLINMLHNIRLTHPGICLGAVQKGGEVYRRDDITSVERTIWKELNPEAVHLYTDKELIILENGFFPNREGTPDFGYTYTILPLIHVNGVEIADSKEYSLLEDCTIYLGQNRITYHFDVDNEEMYSFYNSLKKI